VHEVNVGYFLGRLPEEPVRRAIGGAPEGKQMPNKKQRLKKDDKNKSKKLQAMREKERPNKATRPPSRAS